LDRHDRRYNHAPRIHDIPFALVARYVAWNLVYSTILWLDEERLRTRVVENGDAPVMDALPPDPELDRAVAAAQLATPLPFVKAGAAAAFALARLASAQRHQIEVRRAILVSGKEHFWLSVDGRAYDPFAPERPPNRRTTTP
jgi:hypothetical protein